MRINFLKKGKQVNNFYVKHKANLIFSKFTVTTSTRQSFLGLAPATGDKPYPTAREEGCIVHSVQQRWPMLGEGMNWLIIIFGDLGRTGSEVRQKEWIVQ